MSSSSCSKRFTCAECGLSVTYDYFGCSPPFADKRFQYAEKAYVLRSPFDNSSGGPAAAICLGAPCSECERPVCAKSKCSLFYSKRLCRTCVASTDQTAFPEQVRREIRQMLR
eukprot:GHVU01166022.1.p2 GENE.GHVU01166022.1~~GHVU01166022.1.p2  ORF type:complete len:113 (+),score=13.87 GHVU01166022.1:505-843(+)